MLKKEELKGNVFKKELNLYKCRYGYHNQNTTGGNFGLDFYLKEEFNPKTDFTLNGNYDTKGEILNLSLNSIRIGEFGIKLNKEEFEDLNKLLEYLKKVYAQLNKQEVLVSLK